MKLARVGLRLSIILAGVGSALGLVGAALLGTSVYLNVSQNTVTSNNAGSSRPVQFQNRAGETSEENRNGRALPTLTPTPQKSAITPVPTSTTANPTPTDESNLSDEGLLNEAEQNIIEEVAVEAKRFLVTETIAIVPAEALSAEVEQGTITNTITISSNGISSPIALEPTPQTEAEVQYVEPYTSTEQVQPPPSANSGSETASLCPATSEAVFDLIPIEGQPLSDHPDFRHADLNLALRGYTPVSEPLKLTFYNGSTDPNAPQLHGLFEPNRVPQISNVYQVNEWVWEAGQCQGNPRGCRGEPIAEFWPVTMAGLAVTPGEPIYIPERGSQIYRGNYISMVLYAEGRRITLGYTRRDNVASGYAIHLENFCVDPNLLALYQSQTNGDGWRSGGFLPALRNNQAIGVALGKEIRVAIRDRGSFMDPRSEKDWWRR